MTFLPNIPQAADDPAVSQGQILTNFQQLETVFDVDHVPYTIGVGAGAGYHDRVVFNAVAAAPALGPRSALHTALSAGFAELFFQNGNNVDRQMTNLPITTVPNAGTAGGNITYIDTPWGFRFLWGLTAAFVGTATIVVPALSGTFMAYSLTPNAAPGSTFGCVVQDPVTLTAGNTNNQSLRYIIIMQLP